MLSFLGFQDDACRKQDTADNQGGISNIPSRPTFKTQKSIDFDADEIHHPEIPENPVDQVSDASAQKKGQHPSVE
jgi:hypothetical protein